MKKIFCLLLLVTGCTYKTDTPSLQVGDCYLPKSLHYPAGSSVGTYRDGDMSLFRIVTKVDVDSGKYEATSFWLKSSDLKYHSLEERFNFEESGKSYNKSKITCPKADSKKFSAEAWKVAKQYLK